MNKFYLTILVIFTLSKMVEQNTDAVYLWHDYIFDDLYIVNTMEIHSDSTYTSKDWAFEEKKNGHPIRK